MPNCKHLAQLNMSSTDRSTEKKKKSNLELIMLFHLQNYRKQIQICFGKHSDTLVMSKETGLD